MQQAACFPILRIYTYIPHLLPLQIKQHGSQMLSISGQMSVLCLSCRRSGWKLRLLTRQGPQQGPSGQEIRRAWAYDARTAIVICDPTSPNILQFQAGDAVGALLRRGFFIELQSRFGNIFFVREEVPFGHPVLPFPCGHLIKSSSCRAASAASSFSERRCLSATLLL